MKEIEIQKQKERDEKFDLAIQKTKKDSRTRFWSQVSHEIRTPLNVLLGMSSIAKEDIYDINKVQYGFEKIEETSRILLELVNNIVDYSAIETNSMALNEAKFSLKDMITTLTIDHYQMAKEKQIHYDIHVQQVTEENVIGDEHRICQILHTLLIEVIRNTKENNKIDFSVIQVGGSFDTVYMQFVIHSTQTDLAGQISRELKKRQADPGSAYTKNVLSDSEKESGIEFFIINTLIQMMDGKIEVSEKDGCLITLDLPLKKTNDKADNQVLELFQNDRILLVSDDMEHCKEQGRMLKSLGIPYDIATTEEDALDQIGEAENDGKPYCICIMDWYSKVIKIGEMTAKIRSVYGEDIVLVASVYDAQKNLDMAVKMEINYVVERTWFRSTVLDAMIRIKKGQTAKKEQELKNRISYNFDGKRVLIAEDITLNMEVIVKMLSRVGISVTCAANGKEAVQIYEDKPSGYFDCIFLDINMPVMDGYEAARQIRNVKKKDAKRIAIYAMTANAFAEDIAEALRSGMDGHISKPVDVNVLYRTLNAVFTGSGEIKENSFKEQAAILEKQNEELKYQAEHDLLTGAWNRYAFEKITAKLMVQNVTVGFLLADIDYYKEICDMYGQEKGDQILAGVYLLLDSIFGKKGKIVRLGEERFAVILDNIVPDENELIRKTEELESRVSVLDDEIPALSLSFGAAYSENGYEKSLYQHADMALAFVKSNQKGTCQVYSKDKESVFVQAVRSRNTHLWYGGDYYYVRDDKDAGVYLQHNFLDLLLQSNRAIGIVSGYLEKGLPVCTISEYALKNLNYTYSEFMAASGGNFSPFLSEEDQMVFLKDVSVGTFYENQVRLIDKENKILWFNETHMIVNTSENRFMWIATFRPIDDPELQAVRETVAEGVSEQYYAIYHIWMKDATYTCFREKMKDTDGVLDVRGKCELVLDDYIDQFVEKEDQARAREFADFKTLKKRLKEFKTISIEYQRKGVGWTRGQFIAAKCDENGDPVNVLYTVLDINGEKEQEIKQKENEYKATHDEITGLPNQVSLENLCRSLLSAGKKFSFLVLDVDHFKDVRSRAGHKRSNEILREIVEIIRTKATTDTELFHITGDEFVIVYQNEFITFPMVCSKIMTLHREIQHIADEIGQFSVSTGLVMDCKGTYENIYNTACELMYCTKLHGAAGCTAILPDCKEKAEWHDDTLQLKKDLALANNNTGTWRIEYPKDGTQKRKMYGDTILKQILGVPDNITPEDLYIYWESRVNPDYLEVIQKAFVKMMHRGHVEASYPWKHPESGYRNMRFGGTLDENRKDTYCFYGYHQDLLDTVVVRKKDDSKLIISAMTKAYFCNYYLSLQDGSYISYNEDYDDEQKGELYHGYIKDVGERYLLQMVSEEEREKVREFMNYETLDQRLKTHEFIDCEFLSTTNKGWCRATFFPVKWDKNHKLTHVMFVIAAIDESKVKELELQRKVQEALKEAKSANNAKTEFLSRMSHDIRTPMNAIIGMTALAAANIDNTEKVKDSLSKINISSRHLLSLINEVLDMRQIESGNLRLAEDKFNLCELCAEFLQMVRPGIKEHFHVLDVEIRELHHELVIGDTLRMKQILINIMSNATKYTPDGGKILFSLEELFDKNEQGKAFYRFTVKDNGNGMSEEFLEHIFEPFARETDTRTNRIQGTGLGMSIVQKLVEMMGGTIHITSKIGEGSCFVIEVPLTLQEGADPLTEYRKYVEEKENGRTEFQAEFHDDSEVLKENEYEGKRVLVVEDQLFNREITVEFLKMSGLLVESAENGKIAVEMLENHEPGYFDLVFMDIQMPVMNGYEAARAIRKEERKDLREIPIVAFSANAFAEDEAASLQAGMNAHMAKPIDIPKLNSILEQFLQK